MVVVVGSGGGRGGGGVWKDMLSYETSVSERVLKFQIPGSREPPLRLLHWPGLFREIEEEEHNS